MEKYIKFDTLDIIMKKVERKTIIFRSPKIKDFGDPELVKRIIKKYKLDE